MVRPAAAPVSPLEIVAADDIIAGWDAAVRVDVAGAVFTLPDVSGNGFNLDQAVALNQPTLVVGGGPNGNDSILFDGVDDFLRNAALDLPAPATTPTTYWGVFRQVTWSINDIILRANAGHGFIQNAVTPAITQFNGNSVNINSGMLVNIYTVFESLFTGSPSDFILAGGVFTTGADAGNLDPVSTFTLGANEGAVGPFANIEVCELWLFRIPLTIQQRSQLRAYATNRYGPIP